MAHCVGKLVVRKADKRSWWAGHWRARVAWALVAAGAGFGCRTALVAASQPASEAARAYATALRADDNTTAWAMYSADGGPRASHDGYAEAWRHQRAERMALADAIEAALQAGALQQRATWHAADQPARRVELVEEAHQWRVQTPLLPTLLAATPAALLRLLATRLGQGDLLGVAELTSMARKAELTAIVRGLREGLASSLMDPLVMDGEGRRVLRWDYGPVRYQAVLVEEQGEWRLDDLRIQLAPASSEREP